MSQYASLLRSYDFKKHGPRKNINFYKKVSELYNTEPEKAIEVIKILPKIGYYKDFFYILEVTDNQKLIDYLYGRIIFMINKWKQNRYLLLAKWIPREKSSFDRKYDFVNALSQKMYPEMKSSQRKATLRKLVSNVCSKLNTLESNLCAKTYDKITTFTDNNLKTYEKVFMRNEELQKVLVAHLEKKYSNFSILQLVREHNKKPIQSIKAPIIEKYISEKIKKNTYEENRIIILDLSPQIVNNGMYKVISELLKYSSNHNEFIIGGTQKIIKFINPVTIDQLKQIILTNISKQKLLIKSPDALVLTDNPIKNTNYRLIKCNSRKTNLDTEILKRILTRNNKLLYCFLFGLYFITLLTKLIN